SAQPMAAVPLSKIDPLQRERIKASIRRSNNADKALLELGDGDFDRALGLVKDSGGRDYLTLAGVLLLTDEQTIRKHVPTYEIAFQVLSGNLDIQVNDYMRKPLVEAYDNIVERFTARIEESEMMVGARRRVAPNFDIVGFREALTNALVHRDYCVLGTVIVKLDHYGLSIYSPGGFVDGVSLENILSTAPKSRNTLLADIAKRIGLAERTGTPKMLNLEGDDFAYESAFNQFRDNVILIDNSSIASLKSLLTHLKAFRQKHLQYSLSLLGYAEWQAETTNLLDDLFAFDTYIISPYFYNELDARSKAFKRSYERNFRARIGQNAPRYAELGFDLGYYFMSGVSKLGDTFEQMQGSLTQEPYQNWFHFERSASGMSFSNSYVQFIHFTPENRIELIR
ncbi:MAG: hypothetical protein J5733_04345, partial [Bacteroidaceae bacterium]|nr:hypothetical protein [Bacteroidaceae bacterium]